MFLNKFIYFLLILGFVSNLFSQDDKFDPNRLSSSAPKDVDLKPLPYGDIIDERDVLWKMTVWEEIDLFQKFNFPLYFPIDTMLSDSGKLSLFDALVKHIKNGDINSVYSSSNFKEKVTDISSLLNTRDTIDAGIDQLLNEGEVDEDFIDDYNVGSRNIERYRLRGIWYFDSTHSDLRYRIMGIAPVGPDVYSLKSGVTTDSDLVEYFWVAYTDEVRNILSKYFADISSNQVVSISFDNLLNSRRFHSSIYRRSNPVGNRSIQDYTESDAYQQILERMRYKDDILNFENNLWEY